MPKSRLVLTRDEIIRDPLLGPYLVYRRTRRGSDPPGESYVLVLGAHALGSSVVRARVPSLLGRRPEFTDLATALRAGRRAALTHVRSILDACPQPEAELDRAFPHWRDVLAGRSAEIADGAPARGAP